MNLLRLVMMVSTVSRQRYSRRTRRKLVSSKRDAMVRGQIEEAEGISDRAVLEAIRISAGICSFQPNSATGRMRPAPCPSGRDRPFPSPISWAS